MRSRTFGIATLALGVALVPASPSEAAPVPVRFATFNSNLSNDVESGLTTLLETGTYQKAHVIAEIIQRVRPDVVLLNEFDYDPRGEALSTFERLYLAVPHNGAAPIHFAHRFHAPSNTGIPSGFDLDNSGSIGGGNDAFGFGNYPGHFGMAALSRFPIQAGRVRTFQLFLWKDMPGALLPDNASTPAPADYYSPAELAVFRLSSKSHWDVPLQIRDDVVHFLASHPTPPVFDGPEDRNGRRNHDEIRLFADYVDPGKSAYVYDDAGVVGGLPAGAKFIVAGDLNADPFDGDGVPGAANQISDSPLVNVTITPTSDGGRQQSLLQGGVNASHQGDPAADTADFADFSAGNLRADYVLPSRTLETAGAGVFWPLASDPLFGLVGTFPFPGSDHRMVWVDVLVGE